MIKGQNFRLFIDGVCLAGSKTCTVSQSAQTEDITSKDSLGNGKDTNIKLKSWSGSADALVFDITNVQNFIAHIISGDKIQCTFQKTEGDPPRTPSKTQEMKLAGSILINDLTIKSVVNEEIIISIKFLGWGPLTNVKE